MDAERKSACRLLARELEIRLRAGIFLSQGTLQFAASTFSIEDAGSLGMLLEDPDNSDAQTLLELIFTPDEDTRVDLEEIVEKYPYDTSDEKAVINHLFQKKIDVPIHFPNDADTLLCRPTQSLLETWVRSLRITARLPAKLDAAVDQHTSSRARLEIKAALRTIRVEWQEPFCAFLARLMEKSDCSKLLFRRDLDLCIAIYSEQLPAASLYDLFMVKKRRLLGMLRQAEKFEKQLAGNNIETLILQGVRAPHIDKADARDKVARIDAICLAVFGCTDPLLQIPTTADLGNFNSREDLDKAFKILS